MLKIVRDDINVDFMGKRKGAFLFSGLICTASLISVLVLGLNQGIDFKGGTSVIVSFQEGYNDRQAIEQSVAALVNAELGTTDTQVSVQDFSAGASDDSGGVATQRYLIYTEITSLISAERQQQLTDRLKKDFGDKTAVDRPAESADIFYLSFPEEVSIPEREAAIAKAFADQGYEDIHIVSDYERQLDVSFIKEYNLFVLEAEDSQEGTSSVDDFEKRRAEFEVKKQGQLKDKKDKRFTVTVEELKGKLSEKLAADFGDKFVTVDSSTSVSPSVGQDLLNNGLLAILYAIIGILIYITLRFDFRYAPGAVVALMHDVIITMGIFSVAQVKFSLPIIAALLTIVGYSLNDTIVVLDRVRETFDAFRGREMKDLLNKAINDTLSRTVLTSVTTLFVVIAILILGGGLIQDFAFALLIGVVIGTYSSIFVASPLVYYMDQYLTRREKEKAQAAKQAARA